MMAVPQSATEVTKEWLTEILDKKFQSFPFSVDVTRCEVTDDLAARGDNFCSSTARINVEYTLKGSGTDATHEVDLFAKFLPKVPAHRGFVQKLQLFDREAEVYQQLLPAMVDAAGKEYFQFLDRNVNS